MIIRLNLTEEHLKLIPVFFIQENDDEKSISVDKEHMYCIGSHLVEDLAMALGYGDKFISGTEEDADGKAFPDDIEAHLLEVHQYIVDNLYYIETLIHQFVTKGGITPGTYKARDNDLIWERVN